MAEERNPLQFLGRVLGTSDGWDGDPGVVWDAYNFIPALGVSLPACDTLTIDEVRGNFEARNDANETVKTFDIVTILTYIPKSV